MHAASRLVVALAIVVALLGARDADAETLVARLTGDAVPLAYDITIAPNVERLESVGSETIDLRLLRPLDAIALNARKIRVTRAAIDGRAATVQTLAAIEQIRLRTGARLAAGRHRVELSFTSAINDGTASGGLVAVADTSGNAVTTAFEPSTARTVFPCFDEPQFRARFTLHVRAPPAWTVVSNMPLHEVRDAGGGLAQSDFDTTPPMPVYLLTLDGGAYAHVEGRAGTVPIRVFVRPGQEEHARAMLAAAQRLLPFYEKFFGVPYPLPKLDLFVSAGYSQSALEGWGAITFYYEAGAFGQLFGGGERGERYAAELLAHEMAHQWAGDLVTMRWWRDTFVAEALATYAQRRAVRAVFPELETWRDDDRSVVDVMRPGVVRGARASVHEIRTDLDADDSSAFSWATYDKGASVIEGWQEAIGEERFRAALHGYLTHYAYASASFEDFWRALGGPAGVAYGRSWLVQRGYPVVDVRVTCVAGRAIVALAQTPFVTDPQIDAAYRAQRWDVSVTLHARSEVRRVVLRGRAHTERMQTCDPITVDPGARPYYLVRYDAARYRELAAAGASTGERARGVLLRDATILHAADALPDRDYLRLLAALAEPLDADVWNGVAREYARMDDLVRGAPEARLLYAMQVRALFPLADRYGRLGSASASSRPGAAAANALSAIGDPVVGAAFKDDFVALEAGTATTGFDPAIFSTPALAAAVATAADIDRAEASLRAYASAHGATVTTLALAGDHIFLTNVGEPALARRVLADAMADGVLTNGAPLHFLFSLGRRHPDLAYGYLRAHLAELEKPFPPTQQAWAVANGVATTLWPAAQPHELERFLNAAFPADRGVVRQAVATMELRWSERRALRAALREMQAHAASGCTRAVSC